MFALMNLTTCPPKPVNLQKQKQPTVISKKREGQAGAFLPNVD